MLNTYVYLALFFQSVAAFMVVFFLIQYLILQKKEFLYYTLYLLVIFIYYFCAIPELFFKITDGDLASRLFSLFKRPIQFMSSVFYTLFIIQYLGLRDKSHQLYKLFRVLISSYWVLAIACFIGNVFKIEYSTYYYVITLLLLPLQFYIVIALLKKRVDYSKYIVWGTIIILVGSLITLLISIYGKKSTDDYLGNAVSIFIPVQICLLVDMFLFSIALQKKIADNEKSLINAAYSRQEAVLLERERIIADLHDDVGGGLSSIRMMSDLMVKQQNNLDQQAANSFANKISATAKDIALRMHTIIWSLNEQNDTLENFIEYARQYGFSFFENSGVRFQCLANGDLPVKMELKGVERKNLFLIIKEAFNNTLKHADATEAELNVSSDGKNLKIVVTDNGSGIRNPNQFGNGLKNIRRRIAEIGGAIDIHSNNGTTIRLELPVK